MKLDRRRFVRSLAAGALGSALGPRFASAQGLVTGRTRKTYDVVVIGAGCFGAWTAYHLQQAGRSVLLLDKYGPANNRASSGGETRVIRTGYGADELYTRFAMRSLGIWQSFSRQVEQTLFHRAGVLWMAREQDPLTLSTLATLQRLGVRHERLSRPDLESRYPQIALGPITWAIFEPDSGALMARRAVQTVVQETVRGGADYALAFVDPPSGKGKLASVHSESGETVSAAAFVFACGPWLPKVLPDVLAGRIFPTRQEVFFFGVPPGDQRFSPSALPVWVDFTEQIYGIPDIESRGVKVAPDSHGPDFDPDRGDRAVTPETTATIREFVGRRFPALKDAPIVETRVCQYENTSNGDFLLDRHPDFDNVWIAGGGSGHGFKHGPAVGEYMARQVIEGGAVEPRFTLATKEKVQKRTVF
jgi:sarcosine oxidase